MPVKLQDYYGTTNQLYLKLIIKYRTSFKPPFIISAPIKKEKDKEEIKETIKPDLNLVSFNFTIKHVHIDGLMTLSLSEEMRMNNLTSNLT